MLHLGRWRLTLRLSNHQTIATVSFDSRSNKSDQLIQLVWLYPRQARSASWPYSVVRWLLLKQDPVERRIISDLIFQVGAAQGPVKMLSTRNSSRRWRLTIAPGRLVAAKTMTP